MGGRTPKTMRVRARIAMLGCAAVVAGCGSSSATDDTTGTSTPAGAATATRTVTRTQTRAASSTSPDSTSSTTAAAPPSGQCVAADLALSFLGGQGATGHGELGFELRNISNSTCHTYGYPGVLFLDRAGKALPTDSTRTTQDFFGSVPENKLDVAPGQSVSFRLGVTHGAASPVGCTTAYGLQVIPPDDTATLHVAIVNGGAYECRTATVSPLQPGTSAFR